MSDEWTPSDGDILGDKKNPMNANGVKTEDDMPTIEKIIRKQRPDLSDKEVEVTDAIVSQVWSVSAIAGRYSEVVLHVTDPKCGTFADEYEVHEVTHRLCEKGVVMIYGGGWEKDNQGRIAPMLWLTLSENLWRETMASIGGTGYLTARYRPHFGV